MAIQENAHFLHYSVVLNNKYFKKTSPFTVYRTDHSKETRTSLTEGFSLQVVERDSYRPLKLMDPIETITGDLHCQAPEHVSGALKRLHAILTV